MTTSIDPDTRRHYRLDRLNGYYPDPPPPIPAAQPTSAPPPAGPYTTEQRFARELRRLLHEHGVSTIRLAVAIEVHPTTVGYWIRGERKVTVGNVRRIAQALKLDEPSCDVLLCSAGYAPSHSRMATDHEVVALLDLLDEIRAASSAGVPHADAIQAQVLGQCERLAFLAGDVLRDARGERP